MAADDVKAPTSNEYNNNDNIVPIVLNSESNYNSNYYIIISDLTNDDEDWVASRDRPRQEQRGGGRGRGRGGG